MIRVPCRGCEERRAGCHAECEKYKQFRAEADGAKEKQNAEYAGVKHTRAERTAYYQARYKV